MHKRYYIIFTGSVQGVGFRSILRWLAQTYQLAGFCQNLNDGTVHCEVEGLDTDIDQFLKDIRSPRHFIKVEDYYIKEIPIKNESTFMIRY